MDQQAVGAPGVNIEDMLALEAQLSLEDTGLGTGPVFPSMTEVTSDKLIRNLGDIIYCAMDINPETGTKQKTGTLRDFFPVIKDTELSEEEASLTFVADKFLFRTFFNELRNSFPLANGEYAASWYLFIKKNEDSPGCWISDEKGMREFLKETQKYFKENPEIPEGIRIYLKLLDNPGYGPPPNMYHNNDDGLAGRPISFDGDQLSYSGGSSVRSEDEDEFYELPSSTTSRTPTTRATTPRTPTPTKMAPKLPSPSTPRSSFQTPKPTSAAKGKHSSLPVSKAAQLKVKTATKLPSRASTKSSKDGKLPNIAEEVTSLGTPLKELTEILMAQDNDDSIPKVLSRLMQDSPKGEAIDGNFQEILPISSSPSEQEWAECCQLLLLNPKEHKDPKKRSVNIPGSVINVTPRQYWTAYQMLTCRDKRGMCGGMLTDIPGLGKTYSSLTFLLLRALIFHIFSDVKKSWTTKSGRHTPQNATEDAPCKCGNGKGLECYASPKSVTRRIADTLVRGPTLIQVASGVIEEWMSVFCNGKLSNTYYYPIAFHTKVPRPLTPPPNLKLQLKTTASLIQGKKIGDAGAEVNIEDCRFTYTPSEGAERYIFLTTYGTTEFEKMFQIPISLKSSTKRGSKAPEVYGCPIGVHIVDEFHKVKGASSRPYQLIESHKYIRGGDMDFWSVTGTPMPSRLLDVDTTLKLLHRPEWENTEHRHHGKRVACLEDLDEAYKTATGTDEAVTDEIKDAFYTKATALFTPELVIRNAEFTRFFGIPIIKAEQIKPDVVSAVTPLKFIPDLQVIASEALDKLNMIHGDTAVASKSFKGHRVLQPLQVLSTFPGAATLAAQGKLNLETEALRSLIKELDDRSDVSFIPAFKDNVDQVIEGSAKMKIIQGILRCMVKDIDSRPILSNGPSNPWTKEDDLTVKKMVIITPSLGEAIFLFMGIKKTMPTLNPVLYHQDLKSSQKNKIREDWASLKKTKSAPHYRVFITPFEVGGVGLNLQTANYQVVTGPLRTKADEEQAFARTNREGQLLKLVHFMLVTEDNPYDRLAIARQGKCTAVSDPFDVSSELELRGSSSIQDCKFLIAGKV